MLKFEGNLELNYNLKTITGLRIGGSKEEFDIGGLDNPVIKTPASIKDFYGKDKDLPAGVPYIPGSSLKGKIRSLLEWATGRVDEMIKEARNESSEERKKIEKAGKPCDCGECPVCVLFGTGDAKTLESLSLDQQPGPTRLIVYDAYPTYDTLRDLQEELGQGIYTEIKTENHINRINSRANPRKVERVPAGAVFEGKMVLRLFKEKDLDHLELLLGGLRLLEDTFLGGYGSRGSGRVKFENIEIFFAPKDYYLGKGEKKELGEFASIEEIKVDELKAKLKGG